MIVIALCAVLVVAIATLAVGTHRSRQHPGSHRETEHEGWTSAEQIRELGDAPPTPHPAAWEPVMAAPTASQPPWDWAAGVQPDPETAQPPRRDFMKLAMLADLDAREGKHHIEPRPVTLAPMDPGDIAPAPAADALTLLDERQQLIDHAKKLIAAAKFDRLLGGVMADA